MRARRRATPRTADHLPPAGAGTSTSTSSSHRRSSTPSRVACERPVTTPPSGSRRAAARHRSSWVRGPAGQRVDTAEDALHLWSAQLLLAVEALSKDVLGPETTSGRRTAWCGRRIRGLSAGAAFVGTHGGPTCGRHAGAVGLWRPGRHRGDPHRGRKSCSPPPNRLPEGRKECFPRGTGARRGPRGGGCRGGRDRSGGSWGDGGRRGVPGNRARDGGRRRDRTVPSSRAGCGSGNPWSPRRRGRDRTSRGARRDRTRRGRGGPAGTTSRRHRRWVSGGAAAP